jgi:hypothetical protein
MYLDVYDEDNRIHPRSGTWLPDQGYENYPVGPLSTQRTQRERDDRAYHIDSKRGRGNNHFEQTRPA